MNVNDRRLWGGALTGAVAVGCGALLHAAAFGPGAKSWSWTQLGIAIASAVGLSLVLESVLKRRGERVATFGTWQFGGLAAAVAYTGLHRMGEEMLDSLVHGSFVPWLWFSAFPMGGLISYYWFREAERHTQQAAKYGGTAGLVAGCVLTLLIAVIDHKDLKFTVDVVVSGTLFWGTFGFLGGAAIDRGWRTPISPPVVTGLVAALPVISVGQALLFHRFSYKLSIFVATFWALGMILRPPGGSDSERTV